MNISALFTDFYELTMMQGYYLTGKNPRVVFDMFFRSNPHNNGYAIFAGLNTLLHKLETLHFTSEDIDYLKSLGSFNPEFLEYLTIFKFSGDVTSMPEGTIAFPNEPLLRIEAPLMEAQLIEGLVLNQINYQTLIATKASRVFNATGKGKVLEFGLRRAHGFDGALTASRAAYIGGVTATSNTMAGRVYNIPVSGTMAHSWVMAFDSELESFRQFVKIYGENAILLIDTYDTLGSGIENAIIVGQEQRKCGKCIGVRLDSGDLSYLSKEVRSRLDKAGLEDTKIAVSNELNEDIIAQLILEKAPIDFWGVGTKLITGDANSSLNGVYKLAAREKNGEMIPTMKISNNPYKVTNPGVKQILRFYENENRPIWDLIILENENINITEPVTMYHPILQYKKHLLKEYSSAIPLLKLVMKEGKTINEPVTLKEIRKKSLHQVESLHSTYTRLINPHEYKVSISNNLRKSKFSFLNAHNPNGTL